MNVIGQERWITQNSGTTQTINSAFFTDTNTGWVIGADGTILKTTDGGTNWNHQTSGITNRLNAVYFVDDTTGWAVGAGGIISRTITGGYDITSLQKHPARDPNSKANLSPWLAPKIEIEMNKTKTGEIPKGKIIN